MSMAERLGGECEGDTQDVRQVVGASFIGTTIEWYDFFLYGTAAALVFNELFFPKQEPLTGTLLAFATYGVGFAARPVGGIIFGHYGDRVGRKAMLVISLLIMGIATALIGLLPTYETLGIWAAVLLVVLRLAQGFGVGGEWGGAVLMAVEYAPKGKRGLFGAWPQMGVPAGLLLSTGIFTLLSSTMSESAFNSWGWRIPFLLSIVLVGVGLFIRLKLMETPAFTQVKEAGAQSEMPIAEVLRTQKKNVLLAMGMRVAENGTFYILTVFVLAYVVEIGLEKNDGLIGVMIAAGIGLLTIPLWGAMSDRVGRRLPYLIGSVLSIPYAFVFFLLVNTKEPVLIWLAIVIGVNILHNLMYGPQAAYFSELFGTKVRYTGASLGYQFASIFAGGLAPLVATALYSAYGWEAVAVYMAIMAAITVVSVWLASETYQDELTEERAAEAGVGVPGRGALAT